MRRSRAVLFSCIAAVAWAVAGPAHARRGRPGQPSGQGRQPVLTLGKPFACADYGGMVMIAESGPMRIIEVDRQGNITKEVKLTTKCRGAHGQMRCARKTAKGTYIIGQYSEGLVREYDDTGRIIREIKQKPAFGGIRLPDGNTLIATGDGHRIYEIDKDDNVVWEIKEHELPGNPLRFIAGMQRLPNGNTLVCNWGGHGHVGKQPQIFEVTRDKKVVGEIYDYKQFSTLSGVFLIGIKADPTKFEVLR